MTDEQIQKRIKEIAHKLDNLKMETYDSVPEDFCAERMSYDELLSKAVSDLNKTTLVRELLFGLVNEIRDL